MSLLFSLGEIAEMKFGSAGAALATSAIAMATVDEEIRNSAANRRVA